MLCSKCHANKTPEDFSIDRNRTRGKALHCKTCMKIAMTLYVSREKPAPTSPIRTCTKCLEEKPLEDYYKDNSKHDGYMLQCKKCKRERVREYCKENPEIIKEQKLAWKKTPNGKECDQRYYDNNREEINAKLRQRYADDPEGITSKLHHWRINNPEKAQAIIDKGNAKRQERLASLSINDFDDDEWIELLILFNYRCAYCHRSDNRFDRDHIFPVSKGGPNTKSNIAPSCRSCNSRKGDKIIEGLTQPLLLERLATQQPLFEARRKHLPSPPASRPAPAPAT